MRLPHPPSSCAARLTTPCLRSWCTNGGRGTRIIPEGTITSVQFLQTDRYIQLSGTMDGTKLNIPANDDGGELDPHGADGNGQSGARGR